MGFLPQGIDFIAKHDLTLFQEDDGVKNTLYIADQMGRDDDGAVFTVVFQHRIQDKIPSGRVNAAQRLVENV